MGHLREWTSRLGVLLTRRSRHTDEDLRNELEFHREQLEQDLLERGLDPAAARQEARRQLGPSLRHVENYTDQRSWFAGETLIQDVRYGFRTFLRTPGSTAAALATLALGIAVTTTVLTVAYGVLVRPLPYASPQELVYVSEGRAGSLGNLGFGTFADLRDRTRTLSSAAAIRSWQTTDRKSVV